MQVTYERCTGLDVHRDTAVATVCAPGRRRGSRSAETRTFKTTVWALAELGDWLACEQVELVGMEATGVYWKPVFAALEDRFTCWLVNAAHLRNIPGRKTDVGRAAAARPATGLLRDARPRCGAAGAGHDLQPPGAPLRTHRNGGAHGVEGRRARAADMYVGSYHRARRPASAPASLPRNSPGSSCTRRTCAPFEPLAEKIGALNAVVARDVTDSGTTAAASIPLAFSKLVERGEIGTGDPVLPFGFGGNLSYAGQVVRCP